MASWFDWLAKCENVQWQSHFHVDCCWKVFKLYMSWVGEEQKRQVYSHSLCKNSKQRRAEDVVFVKGPWSRVRQQAFANFTFLTAQNHETKSSVTERMIRTHLSRIWRYFTFKHTERYVDVLPDFSRSYNAIFHRSIKRSDPWLLSWLQVLFKTHKNKLLKNKI